LDIEAPSCISLMSARAGIVGARAEKISGNAAIAFKRVIGVSLFA